MQQQEVLDAALALVRSTTDASTRSAASHFLEQWNQTPDAWAGYGQWLQSFRSYDAFANSHRGHLEPDAVVGMQLLCFQLLQAKIRREVTRQRPPSLAGQSHKNTDPLLPPHLEAIQSELAAYLQTPWPANNFVVVTPVCICLAALSIRTGQIGSLVESCCRCHSFLLTQHQQHGVADEGTAITIITALRLLANIPLELEACADLSPSQVAIELQPFVPAVLHCIQQVLSLHLLLFSDTAAHEKKMEEKSMGDSANKAAQEAVHALKCWVTVGRVTLSMLNTSCVTAANNNCNGTTLDAPLLVVLLHLLSSGTLTSEQVVVQTSQVLTEAILLPTDSSTETRAAACHLVFQCFATPGFVSQLQRATDAEWEDACHALAVLVATFVTEEVDSLVQQPAETISQLLLQIQNHPLIKVRLVVLECWLTVQEIPTSERHEQWKAPLFRQVVTGLLNQAAYPSRFTSWTADECELDETDFEEFRRLVKDVLVSSYFLLRSEYVQSLVECVVVTRTDWASKEVALFGLICAAREICARVKSNTSTTLLLAEDRTKTSDCLLQSIHHLMSLSPHSDNSSNDPVAVAIMTNHPVLLSRISEFIGAFAPTWACQCAPDAMFQLLYYLRTVLVVLAESTANISNHSDPTLKESTVIVTAKAIKSILINCAPRFATNPATHPPLRESLRALMDAGISTYMEEAMITVAEGCTRALMTQQQRHDETAPNQSFLEMISPVMHRAHAALSAIPAESAPVANGEEVALAIDALGRYLHVIQVIVRFCDAPSASERTPVVYFVALILPFLEQAGQRLAQSEYILDRILSVYEQMLKTAPEVIHPNLQQTTQYAIGMFEKTQHSTSLGFVACAVEHFGASSEDSFRGLLDHIAGFVFSFVHGQQVDERSDLIAAFFQLTQRYLLYCPLALTGSPQFSSIVACAVECLSACRGERESTRATLNFLSQLFGWRMLRLSSDAIDRLQTSSQLVDHQRELHGARIVQACISILVGGSQALWPASTDCVFSVLMSIVPETGIEENPAEVNPPGITVARQWLETAMPVDNDKARQVYSQVVELLLGLVQHGPKSKAKAKMLLTDFSKIRNGEMSVDALVSYSL